MGISISVRRVALGLVFASAATPAFAQQPNLDVMAKWAGYEVVHYNLIGVYTGANDEVARGQSHFVTRKVGDRIEVDFNWNQNQYAIDGKPVYKNSTTTVGPPGDADRCGPATFSGHYEHVTLTAVGDARGPTIPVTGKRDFPAAEIPYLGEDKCGVDSAAERKEDVQMSLLVLPTIYFGNPKSAGANVKVLPDLQTMVMTVDDGWIWTYRVSRR